MLPITVGRQSKCQWWDWPQ